MKDIQTSLDSGQEYFLPVASSKSLKALKPELYLAHVDRAIAEFTSSEICQAWTEDGIYLPPHIYSVSDLWNDHTYKNYDDIWMTGGGDGTG
jgi:hypothetical protein